MPHLLPNRDALALNAAWRRERARLLTTNKQNANTEARHGVPATEKPLAIHQDTPQAIPVNQIFTDGTIPDPKVKRFPRFVKIFRLQVKAGQAKLIEVEKIGDKYILIDGSRRLAAARALKLETISAIVRGVSRDR